MKRKADSPLFENSTKCLKFLELDTSYFNITQFPLEVLSAIADCLDEDDVLNFMLTCRTFRDASDNVMANIMSHQIEKEIEAPLKDSEREVILCDFLLKMGKSVGTSFGKHCEIKCIGVDEDNEVYDMNVGMELLNWDQGQCKSFVHRCIYDIRPTYPICYIIVMVSHRYLNKMDEFLSYFPNIDASRPEPLLDLCEEEDWDTRIFDIESFVQ